MSTRALLTVFFATVGNENVDAARVGSETVPLEEVVRRLVLLANPQVPARAALHPVLLSGDTVLLDAHSNVVGVAS